MSVVHVLSVVSVVHVATTVMRAVVSVQLVSLVVMSIAVRSRLQETSTILSTTTMM